MALFDGIKKALGFQASPGEGESAQARAGLVLEDIEVEKEVDSASGADQGVSSSDLADWQANYGQTSASADGSVKPAEFHKIQPADSEASEAMQKVQPGEAQAGDGSVKPAEFHKIQPSDSMAADGSVKPAEFVPGDGSVDPVPEAAQAGDQFVQKVQPAEAPVGDGSVKPEDELGLNFDDKMPAAIQGAGGPGGEVGLNFEDIQVDGLAQGGVAVPGSDVSMEKGSDEDEGEGGQGGQGGSGGSGGSGGGGSGGGGGGSGGDDDDMPSPVDHSLMSQGGPGVPGGDVMMPNGGPGVPGGDVSGVNPQPFAPAGRDLNFRPNPSGDGSMDEDLPESSALANLGGGSGEMMKLGDGGDIDPSDLADVDADFDGPDV